MSYKTTGKTIALTWWTWVWASSGWWWWTGKHVVLQSMGSQRVGHDWATELNWTEGIQWRPNKLPTLVPVCMLCRIWLSVALWTVARLVPLSVGFPGQEYWNGLPCPPPGDLPHPGFMPTCPSLAGRVFATCHLGNPYPHILLRRNSSSRASASKLFLEKARWQIF